MADVGIKVTLDGATAAERELDTLQKKLHDIGTKLREDNVKRTESLKDLRDHTAQVVDRVQRQAAAEQALSGIHHQLATANDRVITAIKGMVVAYGLYKAADYIKDAAMMNARYEELGVVMNVVGRNAGFTSAQMEAAAKGVQSMGITMLESRNAVIKMVDAQLGLNNATRLARVAQDAAVIGQINSSEALQRMTYAIQSGSTLMLRHIGINVSFEAAYQKTARQLGITTNQLSEFQKVQIRANEIGKTHV